MIEFDKYKVLTFDCYGTLIDWESGVLAALRPVISSHSINLSKLKGSLEVAPATSLSKLNDAQEAISGDLSDQQILELFAEFESDQQKGEYIKYREVLRRVVQKFGERLGFEPSPTEIDSLANSLSNWQPFPDTVEALKNLKEKFKLAVISNIDNDLFASSAKSLEVEFDWLITAEQAKTYKPSLHNFELAIQTIGIAHTAILHVAQSLYHDIVPAKSLGISTVWVNRRGSQEGFGATPSATAEPDLEVPDLKTLAALTSSL